MVCACGSFFTKDVRITDEKSVRKEIYEMLRPFLSCGLAKRASGLPEMVKLEAYVSNLPVHEDRLHVANSTLFINSEFTDRKEFCRNHLPVKYDANAPQPVTWPHFLSELLEDEDIFTLQEYLGYRLLPTNRGQTMMLLMDDFGSGYSSLNTLQDTRFDVLKLDRDFFSTHMSNDRGKKIIMHTISMSKDVGLGLIAEGVETTDQTQFLENCGCDTAQGYLYAKPMPVQEAEKYLKNTLQSKTDGEGVTP